MSLSAYDRQMYAIHIHIFSIFSNRPLQVGQYDAGHIALVHRPFGPFLVVADTFQAWPLLVSFWSPHSQERDSLTIMCDVQVRDGHKHKGVREHEERST